MAYEKPFLTTSDHAVGEQCVNRAIDNNRALFFDYLEPKHTTGRDPSDVFIGKGKHDDVLIARTVADFLFISDPLVMVNAPALFVMASGPMIARDPVSTQVGQWKIYVSTPTIYSAVATIKGASIAKPRFAQCFISGDSTGPYVLVSTWDVNGAALLDCDFSLVIWARGVV